MIKLSKKGNYAIKAIIYLGKNQDKLVKIYDISKELKISESLLRRIIASLHKSNIVSTIKGRNGGLFLTKDLKKISVYDILFSVGEDLGISNCTKGLGCFNKLNCQTTDIYISIQSGLNKILRMYTLDKIINKK